MDPRDVTRVVQWSGLDRLLEEGNSIARSGFDRVASAVMSQAAVTKDGFEHLCAALAQQSKVLERIRDLIRNPKATEADELYRRGLRALRAGWFAEAVTELQQAVTINPYAPLAQFSLGVALGAHNEPESAAEAFRRAVRYSSDSPSLNGLAAGAAILGARAFMTAGQDHSARQLASDVRSRVEDCAELELLWAGLDSNVASTTKALNLAPELSELAVTDRMPGAITALSRVVESGTIASVNQAEAIRARLSGGRSTSLISGSPRDFARGYKSWVETQVPLIREEIRDARGRLAQAQGELTNAQRTAELVPDRTGPTPAVLWMILIPGGLVALAISAFNLTNYLSLVLTTILLPLIFVGLGGLLIKYGASGAANRVRVARETRQRADQARGQISPLQERVTRLSERKLLADDLERALERALPRRTFPLTKSSPTYGME